MFVIVAELAVGKYLENSKANCCDNNIFYSFIYKVTSCTVNTASNTNQNYLEIIFSKLYHKLFILCKKCKNKQQQQKDTNITTNTLLHKYRKISFRQQCFVSF